MPGKNTHSMLTIISVILLGFAIMRLQAGDETVAAPTVPKALGGECVAPPEMMRQNHMVMLKHDRDLRVQDGRTDIDYSLKECVACHAVNSDEGTPVSYESPKHFCRTCHDYAAVKVDCFSCHNSKPDTQTALTPSSGHPKMATGTLSGDSWSAKWMKDKADD